MRKYLSMLLATGMIATHATETFCTNTEEETKKVSFYSGQAEDKNMRPYMEDRTLPLTTTNYGTVFGVFDGHGGEDAACLLKKHLLESLNRRLKNLRPKKAIVQSFNFLDQQIQKRTSSGSTASIVLVPSQTKKALIATVGDSAAMWFNLHDNHAPHITEDHNMNNPSERKRIIKHGGTLELSDIKYLVDDEVECLGQGYRVGKPNLYASLNMSRAIGDCNLKMDIKGAVICKPNIASATIKDNSPLVIVVGSDGLWDHTFDYNNYDFYEKRTMLQKQNARTERLLLANNLRKPIYNILSDQNNDTQDINTKLQTLARKLVYDAKNATITNCDNISVQIVVAKTNKLEASRKS